MQLPAESEPAGSLRPGFPLSCGRVLDARSSPPPVTSGASFPTPPSPVSRELACAKSYPYHLQPIVPRCRNSGRAGGSRQDGGDWDREEERSQRSAELTSCTYCMCCTHNVAATAPAPEYSGASRRAWGGLPTTLDSGRRGKPNPCSAAKSVSLRGEVQSRRYLRCTSWPHSAPAAAAHSPGAWCGPPNCPPERRLRRLVDGNGSQPRGWGRPRHTRTSQASTCEYQHPAPSTQHREKRSEKAPPRPVCAPGDWQVADRGCQGRKEVEMHLLATGPDLALPALPFDVSFRSSPLLPFLPDPCPHISSLVSVGLPLLLPFFSPISAKQPAVYSVPLSSQPGEPLHFHIDHTRISPTPSNTPPFFLGLSILTLPLHTHHLCPLMSVWALEYLASTANSHPPALPAAKPLLLLFRLSRVFPPTAGLLSQPQGNQKAEP